MLQYSCWFSCKFLSLLLLLQFWYWTVKVARQRAVISIQGGNTRQCSVQTCIWRSDDHWIMFGFNKNLPPFFVSIISCEHWHSTVVQLIPQHFFAAFFCNAYDNHNIIHWYPTIWNQYPLPDATTLYLDTSPWAEQLSHSP